MATYKSKHTGERVDNAVTKIPENLPTEDSFIVVKADGSASEYIPRSQVSSDKLDKQTVQTTSDQIYGKLADGSQTMFDLTMGAEPTTIPRRDTAGRIQVADGVSGNDAVNFKQLSAVESSVSGLNIQNGSGVNSIQQKYTTDTREFDLPGQERQTLNVPTDLDGTYSTGAIGEQSTELNGRGRSVGKRSFVANNRNLVLGDYASAFGNANIAKGNNAFVAGALNRVDKAAAAFGYNNYVNADSAFVTGSFNTVTGSNATVVSGQGNTASGNDAVVSGQENTASGNDAVAIGLNTTASGNEAVAIGLNTTASGRDSFAGGAGAEATSDCTFAYGVQTKATKTGAIALGYQAEANGANSFVAGVQAKTSAESAYGVAIGYGAEANALHAVAIGHNAKANAQHAIAIGEGNIAVTQGQLVVGKWARPNNYLFAVGNGNDNDHRSLAFLVGQDGRAIVYGAPKDNTDVVRKLELDTKYDKTGGTIGGNVVITGDLTVNGTQHINNTENLNVENAMIYSNATGATLATNGGIGIKKNATDVYGIVYDPTSDSVKLGIGKSDANGRFTFNANEGQPVAIRDDSSKFTNNNLVKWDGTNHKLVDAGKNVDDFVKARKVSGDGFILYGASASNPSDGVEMALDAIGYTVPRRLADGQIVVGTPTEESHATTKKYVDDSLVTTPITETETVVVDTTTVNFALDAEHDTGMYVSAENAISLGSTQLQWNDGRQKYKVIWDGVEYICYVQSTTNPKYNDDGTYKYYDWQILGNGNNKLNCYNKDTNIYPFAITQDKWKNSAEWLVYATTSTAATHTIKVVKIEGTYKKVTPEYQYDYLSMLKNGRSNNTLLHGYSLDDDGLSAGILSGDGNQYVNDVPVGDNYDRHLVIFGDGNRVHRYEATGESHDATIMGSFNELHLKGTGYVLAPFVTGYKNTITVNKGSIHPDAVFGGMNKLTYDGNTTYGLNLVGGGSHTVKNAALSLITGLGNTVECLETDKYIRGNIVGGQQNTVNHDRVIVGGRGNTSDRHGQFIAGNYSAANEKAIVKIGNGTKDAHANAFEVLDDNRAKVFGTPTENNDVLRYQDTAVEVETSLMGA